ncbi:MAG: DNA primase [Alphaproteobacteria bacterium]|nr:DNA primase [Alphaproteobacteria bacterium]
MSGRVARELIDTIRDRVDIVEVVGQVVTLQRKGTSHVGLCPFHGEKTPSFNVVPGKGIYHCFGCGAGGDVFQFVMNTQGVSFMEAVRELGARVGVAVEERELSREERARMKARTDLYEICDLACQYFQGVLRTRPEGAVARDYLAGRGMEESTWERYKLGYAPPTWASLTDWLKGQGVSPELAVRAGVAKERRGGGGAYDMFRGRVIVPIQDARGRVVAFGGRHLESMPGDDQRDAPPKYVNSPETGIYSKSKTLYALSHARPAVQRKGRVLVVEGYFDVLSLHQAGFTEAVATCGTALTDEHLQLLRPLTTSVVALFDSDSAGVRAALKSLDMFVDAGMEARRLDLGESKDPDEFVQAHGADAFEALLRDTETLFDMAVRHHKQRCGATPAGRRQALDAMLPTVRRLDGARRDAAISRLASALELNDVVVRELVGRGGPPRGPAPDPMGPPPELPPPGYPVPAGPRFGADKDVNHILWLLINHPRQVVPVLNEHDPGLISDRLDVQMVVARLMQGEPLPAVLEDVEDPAVELVLRRCAVPNPTVRDGKGEDLYTAQVAATAMVRLLAKRQLRDVEDALARVKHDLAGCGPAVDRSRWQTLMEQRQQLSQRRRELNATIRKGARP